MNYVLLDTNIIIDMVIDRRDNVVSGNLLKTFIKLLDYGEVKLVLPSIVKAETYRHLDEELDGVEKKINDAIKAINDLYGVSTHDINPLDLSEYKKNAKAELEKAQDQFQQLKGDYQKDIKNTINLLFNHESTLLIPDEDLMLKVLRRRVYKKAPFHKEEKESYGDGTITETLISLVEKVRIEPNDHIFFVTGNYKDFSDTVNDKDKLHPDIIDDLTLAGIQAQVIYVRSFNNLVHPYLNDSIENANLAEEFETEMKEEEEEHYRGLDDELRESAGLTALGSFVNQLEDSLPESQFASDVVEQFERLNTAYRKLEELYFYYEDELIIDFMDCTTVAHKLSSIVGCGNEPTVENIKSILDWIEQQKEKTEEIDISLPDYISIGEDIEFWDVHRRKYVLRIDDLENLTPASGESDAIEISIVNSSLKTIAKGSIDITYGFIEDDPFDGVGDGCEESIDYNTDLIVEKLKEIADEWEEFIKTSEANVESIKIALEQ